MMKLLKRLVVGFFLLVVGLAVLGSMTSKPTTPTPNPTNQEAAKGSDPSLKRVERVARDYFDQLEGKITKANPDATKRTWNGNYHIRPYPDSTGAWVVDFVSKGESQWSMVIACENDKWGLARCVVKNKTVYENPEVHFDENAVWRLK